MKIKEILGLRVNFTLSLVIFIIYLSFIIFSFLKIQGEVDDLMVYASSINFLKDVKNAQYISILRDEKMIVEIKGDRYRIAYDTGKVFIETEPLFKKVGIIPQKRTIVINSDGSFLIDGERYVKFKRGRKEYTLILKRDGRCYIDEND